MSLGLWRRAATRASVTDWAGVREYFTGDDEGDAQMVRLINSLIRRRKLPALIHKGGRPRG